MNWLFSIHKRTTAYLRIWVLLTTNSFKIAFLSRVGAGVFVLGKVLRFVFVLVFLIVLVDRTHVLAGYNLNQTLIFFLTFNIIDTITQLLFRDVYRFRPKVISGDLDLLLVQPVNPLFRILFGGADPLDLFTLIPYIGILIFLMLQIPLVTIGSVMLYLVLFANGLLIAAAFHIFVLSLGVLTTEIDHAIMIYRDLSSMVRFPVDIYREPLRSIITFAIPVGIMVSFPAKGLLGALSFRFVIISIAIGVGFLFGSLYLWRVALRRYTSASS